MIHIALVPCSHLQQSGGISWCTVRHQQVSMYVVTGEVTNSCFPVQFHAYPSCSNRDELSVHACMVLLGTIMHVYYVILSL